MFAHIVLGLLRDGQPRHGYQLIKEYRDQFGRTTNHGNLYRGLAKLVAQGLIEPDARAPDADERRIPYRITRLGRDDFDAWLLSPSADEHELDAWVLFANLLAPADRSRLIEQLESNLWIRSKMLERAREDTAVRIHRSGATGYQPAPLLIMRRSRLIAAHLEFLDELRRALANAAPGPVVVTSGRGAGADLATGRAAAPAARGIPPVARAPSSRRG